LSAEIEPGNINKNLYLEILFFLLQSMKSRTSQVKNKEHFFVSEIPFNITYKINQRKKLVEAILVLLSSFVSHSYEGFIMNAELRANSTHFCEIRCKRVSHVL
jgi:hypothetical protein